MSEERKLTRGLVEYMQASQANEELPIIVRYTSERRRVRLRGPLNGARLAYAFRLLPFEHLHATPEAIHRLAQDPQVLRVYEDLPVYALLNSSVPLIGTPRLWQEGLTGQGVRIAVVDTGVDATHPDLAGRVAAQADFTGEGDGDGNGHGTHCASIALGSGAASDGVYRGVAPGATLYAAKVLKASGSGMMSDVMMGVEWAVEQGVQVISLSLGGPGPSSGDDALSDTCDAAVDLGIVVCVAAGNDGPRQYSIGSPGAARKAITVGASTDNDTIATFSSRGPTGDGRVKPDIVLPGVDVVAARAANTSMGTVVNQYYTSASGTSMATPHAAGVCALLLQAQPHLTPEQIKARLMTTAVDLSATPYAQGSGRVDAWRCTHDEDPEPPEIPETPPSPGQGCLALLMRVMFWGRSQKQ